MNHFISLATAAQMTALFRENRENILATNYQGNNILPIAESFDRSAFDVLLTKPGCAGIRIYYGMSEDLKVHAVIVATDQLGQDILPSYNSGESTFTALTEDETTTEEEYIVDNGNRCPDLCPSPSSLNTQP